MFKAVGITAVKIRVHKKLFGHVSQACKTSALTFLTHNCVSTSTIFKSPLLAKEQFFFHDRDCLMRLKEREPFCLFWSYFQYQLITIWSPNVMFQASIIPLAFESRAVCCDRSELGSASKKKSKRISFCCDQLLWQGLEGVADLGLGALFLFLSSRN